MSDRRILIVDDEASVRSSLEEWFREDGFRVETAADGQAALRAMDRGPFDIVLLDLKMPGMDGIAVQQRLREIDPEATIIILTAYASVETAVAALKLGAYDYVTKPVDPDDLSNLVRNALRTRALAEENARLKEKVSELTEAEPILAVSAKMRHVLEMVRTVAATDSSVVIRGESGTGKELVARAIHAQSKRRFLPLVAVNAGSLPETLLESELFGHEKGAFTGAQYRRKGKVELASGGTLFLDEIGDISPKTQVDLLRVLETHRFTRVGGTQEVTSDFRLVCATHRNLEKLVAEGSFREDLFYRVNVFSIELPPLRERPDDILPLAAFFVEKYARAMGKPVAKLSPEAEAVLRAHRWPGNVRELENAVERAMVVSRSPTIEMHDLPVAAQNGAAEGSQARSLSALEKEHISRVMRECEGNVTRAAKVLAIDRATLYNKLRRHGLRR
jgi:DNA-binding NtrC family response regulator